MFSNISSSFSSQRLGFGEVWGPSHATDTTYLRSGPHSSQYNLHTVRTSCLCVTLPGSYLRYPALGLTCHSNQPQQKLFQKKELFSQHQQKQHQQQQQQFLQKYLGAPLSNGYKYKTEVYVSTDYLCGAQINS